VIELLWLLLPVAAATGWWTGRRRGRGAAGGARGRYAPDYYRGLAYLLDEQQDKAIELFIKLVQVDKDTVETHLTLGNLFRRRGEVDRAIRIHQNLIARPRLPRAVRSEGQLELARDYLAAGLLDRAEGVFTELLKSSRHTSEAYAGLVLIYEREREWRSAIDTAERCYRATGESRRAVIAHYHCEMAEEARCAGDTDSARRLMDEALRFDADCARASMQLGDLAAGDGDPEAAVEHYRTVQRQSPELLPEVIDRLIEAVRCSGDAKALDALIVDSDDQLGAFKVTRAITGLIAERQGERAAARFFKEQLVKRPSLKALHHWAGMELQRRKSGERENIQVVVDMLDRVIARRPGYLCSHCGFKGQTLHWHCPGCHRWDTIRPLLGEENE